MRTTKKRRPGSAISSRPSKDARDVVAAYQTYAVSADGSRHPIDARSIVVVLGSGEVEINLQVVHPILVGQLRIAARGEGLIVVGHADASSIHVGIESIGEGRLSPS